MKRKLKAKIKIFTGVEWRPATLAEALEKVYIGQIVKETDPETGIEHKFAVDKIDATPDGVISVALPVKRLYEYNYSNGWEGYNTSIFIYTDDLDEITQLELLAERFDALPAMNQGIGFTFYAVTERNINENAVTYTRTTRGRKVRYAIPKKGLSSLTIKPDVVKQLVSLNNNDLHDALYKKERIFIDKRVESEN